MLVKARIRGRYRRVRAALSLQSGDDQRLSLPRRSEPIGNHSIVWLPTWNRPSLEALRYAATISDRVVAVWVCGEGDEREQIQQHWQASVGDAPGLELKLLETPYASAIDPFVAFVSDEEQRFPETTFTIVMPMAIPRYRFDDLLLNQRGLNLRRALDAQRDRVFTLVRYYLPV